jgi:predicted Kef-type K+ transport protein
MAFVRAAAGNSKLRKNELRHLAWLFVSVAYLPFFFVPWTTGFQGYLDRGIAPGFANNIHEVEQMAEIGVVLLLFTIGI